ncbi:hypothetical protein D1103_09045 [Actinobacillus pleuropneumoniae serovar 10 str. D13039]|nr:hypothetical protein D1106_09055 [Actinobacillus pleuropneumoniae]UKH33533.1 hypothetical protein D1103_09045 [Actinobacillus pleuropneumoniae serovar 10 str. D13039]
MFALAIGIDPCVIELLHYITETVDVHFSINQKLEVSMEISLNKIGEAIYIVWGSQVVRDSLSYYNLKSLRYLMKKVVK